MDNILIYIRIVLLAAAALFSILAFIRAGKKQDDATVKEIARTEKTLREEIARLYNSIHEQRTAILREQLELQDRVTKAVRESVEKLQESNEAQLEKMRATVDEKLTSTLSERLDTSFKAVGVQLAKVYESLGEMQKLSSGVTDLQRLLTNVKARGTWAEIQLGEILSQTLTSEQYEQNVSVNNNSERVEFAVKIPSKTDDNEFIYLPIDSKFPQEDYLRLCEAAENADKDAVEFYGKALERTVKTEAASISKLYINVPRTTDFAIMFLSTEGLYAEVIRRNGLVEELQNKYRVMVCGPTTITAFLNTLKMGFRTVALDRRAAEVWKVLGAAKQQYERFTETLIKAKRKIDEAGIALEDAQKRNGIIQKSLRNVETIPSSDAEILLGLTEQTEL